MRLFQLVHWAIAILLSLVLISGMVTEPHLPSTPRKLAETSTTTPSLANSTQNLSASLNRLVMIASIAAGSIVTLAWIRVGLSWFSNDPTKKVAAKERARDAALGTFILLAAVTGLAWGLAQWVLTG